MLIVDRQKAKKKKKWFGRNKVCRKFWFRGLNLYNIQKSSEEVPTGFAEKQNKSTIFVASLKIKLPNKQDVVGVYVHFITKQ